MSHAEMNNEIVLLRHAVRQARFCIANKVIREIKLLRNKHGNKVQQEKYKRKADKLIAEIHALKMIKNDDISKFGIMNERILNDILQDQSLNNNDRIMARIIHSKSLYRRLMQFRDKFPDYKTYFTEGKKITSQLKNKTNAKAKKSLKKNSICVSDKKVKEQKVNRDENSEQSQCNSTDEKVYKIESCEIKSKSCKRKKPLNENSIVLDTEKLAESEEDSASEDITINKQSNIIKPCGVTNEATVKRFTELLEEQELIKDTRVPIKNNDSVHITTAQTKPMDDFFITGDDRDDYQENQTNVSMLHAESRKCNTPAKAFQSSSQVKMQDIKYKSDTNFKRQKYDQLRDKSKARNMNKDKKYVDKKSVVRQEESRPNKINKSTKKSNNINDKEKSINLHPSWLAKKKQQEIMNQGFQGKRIVFD